MGSSLQSHTGSLDIIGQHWGEVLTFLGSCSETARKAFVRPSYRKSRLCITSIVRALCKCAVGQMNNWPSISDTANLEKLRIGVQGFDKSLSHPLLRLIKPSCLRRVIPGVETGAVRRPSLDENLASLVRREEDCRDLVLQISTKAYPEKVRGLLPQKAQAGVLGVGFIKRPDYCMTSQ